MKKIYIIFISFSLIACKTNHDIIGIATNAKDGASIRTEDAVYKLLRLLFFPKL